MRKRTSNKLIRDEKGQALVLVLVLILLGSLIITPMLSHIGTGLKVGKEVFEKKMDLFYAADSGVEDGLWQIKYDQLTNLFGAGYNPYAYYAYSPLYEWDYDLTEDVNDKDVNVTIENIWIPRGLTPPDKDVAEFVVEGDKEADPPEPPKVIITGNVPAANTFEIKIQYYPEVGDNFGVNTLGIWLPQGFEYDEDGTCNLDDRDPGPGVTPYYTSHDTNVTHSGGKAVIWSFDNYPFVGGTGKAPFPGVETGYFPMVSTITFKFTGPENRSPAAVSWIDTTLDLGGDDYDITYTWDADTKIYKIVSVAGGTGGTEVEAYIAKSEIRELGSAIAGDYRAIGNSLMIDTPPIDFSTGIRDTLLASSNTTVNDIPLDAEVVRAYLYWSAWRNESAKIFSDTCSDFTKWDRSASGTRWTPSSGRFQGRGSSTATPEQKTLTMKNSLNLSSYAPGAVAVSWNQTKSGTLASGDALYYAFYNSSGWSTDFVAFQGNSTPTSPFTVIIPEAYLKSNFKMRFYFNFDNTNEYVYLDNISVMPADTTAIFKIDGTQVSFDGSGLPQTGGEITTSRSQVLPNYDSSGNPNGFSYACYKDVTELVLTFSAKAPDPATNHPGNAIYTGGSVTGNTGNQWSYAGWSLIIIYQSAETKGHQLYLYDDFIYAHNDTNIDFDHDGDPGGTISGFLVPNPVTGEVNAATLTCFVGEGDACWYPDYFKFNGTALSDGSTSSNVWNSWSRGMSEDGVDIDTFYVTWASDLLEPRDTSAQIDLPTTDDSWNLVYIIISFRSETTTGGAISYLVKG